MDRYKAVTAEQMDEGNSVKGLLYMENKLSLHV